MKLLFEFNHQILKYYSLLNMNKSIRLKGSITVSFVKVGLILTLLSLVRANLSMNDGSADIELIPTTVSADSILPIKDLIRNDGATGFSAGDCF
jgi:hypothetical protein